MTPSNSVSKIPIRRAYDLYSCTLGVVGEDCAAAAFLDPILAPLRCDPPAACDWTISLIAVDVVETPRDGSCLFEGPLPEGLPVAILENEHSQSLVAPGHFAIELDRIAGTAELRYVRHKAIAMGGTAAFWMLADILAAHAHHLLHGASVADPRSDEVIALFAPSGTGKTTTALALARSGFRFACDDALVLSVQEQVPAIWGIPRHVKISRQTAAMLPWLAPCLTDAWVNGEQTVARDALAPFVSLAKPKPQRVGRVIVLQPPNDRDHVLMPMSKPDALAAIAHDNVRVAPKGVTSDSAAAFAALSTLIAMTPVAKLSPGPDPDTLATRLFGL